MTDSQRDLRFLLLTVLVVTALAGAVAVAALQGLPTPSASLWILITLILAAMFAEFQVVILPGAGQISVSYALIVASAVFFGPLWAGVVCGAAALSDWVGPPKPLVARVFNTAQVCLAAVAIGLSFEWLGGTPFYLGNAAQPPWALLAAPTVGAVVNLGLGALGVWLYRHEELRRVIAMFATQMLPSQIALGLVGLAVAQVLTSVGLWGFALFLVPLVVARQTYQRSQELRQAYADTIASLVAALEAKDVYTKGHSIRVARYTVAIARALGLPDSKVDRLEWAALLHDIGKVGVSRRVLAKNGKLTDSEYTEIKEHPAIGARILVDVPYLRDLVPAIAAHHERLDGTGYGRGVPGLAIPLDARILAVADSYDAMTSTRPYRQAMTHAAACAELERCKGTQFDDDVVGAFALAVDADPSLAAQAEEAVET